MVNVSASEKERIRLVELDYDKTNEFIKGVVGTGAALRGSAITVWLALIGFAFQQNLPALAYLAAVVIVVFALVDGYHGWLYAQAATHLRAVEKVTSTYYNALSRGDDDPDAILDFRQELRFHRFGFFSNLRRTIRPWFLWDAHPKVVYRLVYPLLLVLAVAAAIAVGPGGAGKHANKGRGVAAEDATPLVAAALTGRDRARLERLSSELRRSHDRHDHQLGLLLGGVLTGAPGALAALASRSQRAIGAAEQALGTVVANLGRLVSARATFRTTIRVGGPQFSLGGVRLSFRFNTSNGSRPPPPSPVHDGRSDGRPSPPRPLPDTE
jgi:hypothetical protein